MFNAWLRLEAEKKHIKTHTLFSNSFLSVYLDNLRALITQKVLWRT
jgi:hypothetical protein